MTPLSRLCLIFFVQKQGQIDQKYFLPIKTISQIEAELCLGRFVNLVYSPYNEIL